MIQFIVRCKPFSKYIFILLSLTILIVSSIPNIPTLKVHTAKSDIRLDYLIHFCQYGLLAFVAHLSLTRNDFSINFKSFILATAGLMVFAVLDELHQKLIPGRTFSLKDIFSNLSGIILISIISLVIFRYIRDSLKKP